MDTVPQKSIEMFSKIMEKLPPFKLKHALMSLFSMLLGGVVTQLGRKYFLTPYAKKLQNLQSQVLKGDAQTTKETHYIAQQEDRIAAQEHRNSKLMQKGVKLVLRKKYHQNPDGIKDCIADAERQNDQLSYNQQRLTRDFLDKAKELKMLNQMKADQDTVIDKNDVKKNQRITYLKMQIANFES